MKQWFHWETGAFHHYHVDAWELHWGFLDSPASAFALFQGIRNAEAADAWNNNGHSATVGLEVVVE